TRGALECDAGVRGRAGPLRRVVAASASFGECFEAPLELDVSTSRHGTAVRFVGAREPLAIVVERSGRTREKLVFAIPEYMRCRCRESRNAAGRIQIQAELMRSLQACIQSAIVDRLVDCK